MKSTLSMTRNHIHCKYPNLKQTYASIFQISSSNLRKMEISQIYAYSRGFLSVKRNHIHCKYPNFKQMYPFKFHLSNQKDGNFSNLCLLYRGFLSVTRNHIHCKYLNKRNLIPSNLGKMEISQIFAPNLLERNEIYNIEDSSR